MTLCPLGFFPHLSSLLSYTFRILQGLLLSAYTYSVGISPSSQALNGISSDKLKNAYFYHIDKVPSKPRGEGMAFGQRTLQMRKRKRTSLRGLPNPAQLSWARALDRATFVSTYGERGLPCTEQSTGDSKCQCSS